MGSTPEVERELDDKRRIHSISELPFMRDCQTGPIHFLEEPVLVEGTVTALTGDAGSGKSTLVSAWARRIHEAGRPVLILDRENPKVVVDDRFQRLGMSDDATFRVWGGWVGQEAPQPASAIVLAWAISCQPRPLVIIDSMSAFYDGDQNSAREMRVFMNQCRRLADLGATVGVLHHDGKAETAKDYRGSSDFKAAVDSAFHVSNLSNDGHLSKLVLRCYKSRFGFAGEVVYEYAGGRFLLAQQPEAASQTLSEQLTVLLRLNPGVNAKKFEELASERGLGRNRARQFLEEGILARTIRRQKVGKRTSHYLDAESTPFG
jgi:energy-coupling factor transporter ATP-binding protein EcfA2